MYRSALKELEKWKANPKRSPLLIRGARQVGKTWLVREHGRSYASFVEINLESHPEYLPLFKESYGKPHELLRGISLLAGQKIASEDVLLFIDEIQSSKEALLALRYLKEQLPRQPVIAAGSLLEFSFQDLSFPVGRIDFFHLFPMSFAEYLQAIGRTDWIEAIHAAGPDHPLPLPVHTQLNETCFLFSLLGGLPAVVQTYCDTGDLQQCQDIQQQLVANFREDFHKYAAKTNIENLRTLFAALPRLMGQKLKYSAVDPHIKSRDLAAALGLLQKAGLIYKVFHTSANGFPLEAQINPKRFKVFFVDIGLAQRLLGLRLSDLFLQRRDLVANRGPMAEQLVAQELLSRTPKNQSPQLYYWHRESPSAEAEVDFLVEGTTHVIPIEVKSTQQGRLRSLHRFLQEKATYVQHGVKISAANFSLGDGILSVPFYAIGKLCEDFS